MCGTGRIQAGKNRALTHWVMAQPGLEARCRQYWATESEPGIDLPPFASFVDKKYTPHNSRVAQWFDTQPDVVHMYMDHKRGESARFDAWFKQQEEQARIEEEQRERRKFERREKWRSMFGLGSSASRDVEAGFGQGAIRDVKSEIPPPPPVSEQAPPPPYSADAPPVEAGAVAAPAYTDERVVNGMVPAPVATARGCSGRRAKCQSNTACRPKRQGCCRARRGCC